MVPPTISGPYPYTRPRRAVAAMYASPGPIYSIPSTFRPDHNLMHSLSPAYSMRKKFPTYTGDFSPGPAAYNPPSKYLRDGLEVRPAYSMRTKYKESTWFNNPGPGAYSPENSGPHVVKVPPKYTFGLKTALKARDTNPAPNAYNLPAYNQGNRGWTMNGKRDYGSIFQAGHNTPGPANYLPNYNDKGILYTIGEKLGPNIDKHPTPSPASYNPALVKVTKTDSPKYTFGIKHTNFSAPLVTSKDN